MTGPAVEVRVLGAFEVRVGLAAPIAQFPTRRAAELVQLLAISPGHRLLRDQVMEALFPHLDVDAAAANLRKAAHHARQALGSPDAVVLRQQTVALFPGTEVVCDLERFVVAADEAVASGTAAAAEAALGLHGGELLPSARYEDWSMERRDRVAALHRFLLQQAGRWEELVAVDPLDEGAARTAMLAAAAAGQRHRAVAVYGRLRAALARDLGVLPSSATESVWAEVSVALMPYAVPSVGRDRERAAFDAAIALGVPVLVTLRGAAGMGKTTFLADATARLRAAGRTVASATGTEPDDAFGTLRALVADLATRAPEALDRLPGATRAALARLTPSFGAHEGAALTRHQLVGAVQRLVQCVGDGLVLIVDDAHRADESSLAVLGQLVERQEGGPALVLAHRPATADAVERVAGRVARHHPPVVVDLVPFDAAQVRLLADACGAPTDDAHIAQVIARSEGNPFFAAELCRSAAAGGPVQGDAEPSRWFTGLDDDVVAWLRRLALVDGQVELAVVEAITGCSEDDLTRLLDEAIDAEVLTVVEGRYRFRHEIIRAALAEQLAPHHRVAVHRDAARRLADLGARPATVAHHWIEGRRPEQAVDWLLRAATDAVALGGYPAAVEHLDRVLQTQPQHAEALRRRAAALDAMGDRRAIEAYDAAAHAVSLDEAHEIRPLQALAMVKLGDPEGGMRVVAGAEPTTLESQLAKALAYCGAGLMGHADPEIGARLAAEGRRLALRAGDPAAIVVASWAQAGAAHAKGELRSSLQADLEDTIALPRLAVSVFDGQLCITQRLLYGSRPYDDVIDWATRFEQEASRLGAARGAAFATTLRGEAEFLSGRLTDAGVHLRDGRRRHHDLGAPTGEAFALQRLAELAAASGDRRDALRLLDESLAVARESDVGFHLFDRIYGTRIQLARDIAEALALVDEAEELVCGPLETCPGCRITLAVPAAIALARAGSFERLVEYEASCEWLADVVMQLPAWDAALEEVRGHRCLAEGRTRDAVDHLRRSAAGFRTAGQPLDLRRVEALLAPLPV